jgi:YfiH family protein
MEEIIRPSVFKAASSGLNISGFFTTRHFKELPANAYIPVQKHTDKVFVLEHDIEPKIADAVITQRKDIFIGVQVADCVPVLLLDRKNGAIGAVHAGWRGTAQGILKNTISGMSGRFYSSPSDILVAIGPSIRWCCYEVGYEVMEAVYRATGRGDYIKEKGGKYCVDLQSANMHQAVLSGVPQENIWVSNECTFCLPEKYYSYRYAKGTTGRQYGIIGISGGSGGGMLSTNRNVRL